MATEAVVRSRTIRGVRPEDVLEVYTRPYDEKRPVVCLDETNRQLIGEKREPRPVRPGQPALYDYEYARNGVR